MQFLIVAVFFISSVLGFNIYNIYLRHEVFKVTQEHLNKMHEENMLIIKSINDEIDMLIQLQEKKNK